MTLIIRAPFGYLLRMRTPSSSLAFQFVDGFCKFSLKVDHFLLAGEVNDAEGENNLLLLLLLAVLFYLHIDRLLHANL